MSKVQSTDEAQNAPALVAPTPPEKPLPGDCCDSGCEVCVFDVYADELANYQRELAAWTAQNAKPED